MICRLHVRMQAACPGSRAGEAANTGERKTNGGQQADCQWSGGQYQIIVGQNVPKIYDALVASGVNAGGTIDENLDPSLPKEKLTAKKVGGNILNYLSKSMVALIPIILASALFHTISVSLSVFYVSGLLYIRNVKKIGRERSSRSCPTNPKGFLSDMYYALSDPAVKHFGQKIIR